MLNYMEPEQPEGRFVYRTETHYDMLDGQMILHHPQYMIFVERAQQAWMEEVLQAPRFDWRNFPDMYLVVRRIEIDYLHPIEGVQDISIILWPTRIRAANLEMAFEIRSTDTKQLFCLGKRLSCKVNPSTHRPTFWTDAFRNEVESTLGGIY